MDARILFTLVLFIFILRESSVAAAHILLTIEEGEFCSRITREARSLKQKNAGR